MAVLSTLTVKIQVDAQGATVELKNLQKGVEDFGGAFEGISSRVIAAGNLMSSALQRVFSSAVGFLTSTFKEAIDVSQKFNNALVGLAAVASTFGIGAEKATAAARQLSADGLLPLRDSAAGLKNLLMTGFGLDQAIGIMKAFKDTAAFSRQEIYTYGNAIRTATEGIKNMRSVQVDNAGVTKNLSVIMKDAGFVMQDIDSKVKGAAARQALYVGLLREAASQQGLAAASLKTYSGSITALDTAYTSLLATWGDAITRNKDVAIAVNFVADALRGLTQASADQNTAVILVGDTLILFVKLAAGVVRAVQMEVDAFVNLDIAITDFTISAEAKIAKLYDKILDFFKFAATGPGAQIFPGFAQGYIMLDTMSQNLHADMATLGADSLNTKADLLIYDAAMGKASGSLDQLAKDLEANKGKTIGLSDILGPARKKMDDLGNAADATAAKLRAVQTYSQLSDFAKKMGDVGGVSASIDALIAKLPKVAEGLTHTRDAMFGLEEVKTAYLMVQTMGGLENVALLNTKQLKELAKATQEGIEKMQGFGIVAPAAFFAFHDAAVDSIAVLASVKESIKSVEDQINAAVGTGFETDKMIKPGQGVDWNSARMNAGIEKGNIDTLLKESQNAWRKSWQQFALDLPRDMARALESGNSVWAAVGLSAGKIFSDNFSKIFQKAQKDQATLTPNLSGGTKLLGLAGMGIESFAGGYGLGQSTGSKTMGALGGAASGALSGAAMGSVVPGIGTAIGAAVGGIAGLIGGLFGASKKQKEIQQQLQQSRQAMLDQYGGMEKLQQLADKLGVSLAGAFDSKDPQKFADAVKGLNAAIEDEKKKVQGLNDAVTGLNARTATFIDKFKTLAEARDAALQTASDRYGTSEGDAAVVAAADASQKLREMAQASQGEFARLGVITQNVFGGLVKESGDAIGALTSMAPSFQVLKDGIEKFGLQSTAVIDELLKNFDLINNADFKPFFDAIQADGAVLKGLFDAKSLSPEGFQALAADIGASIQGVVDKGGDMARTLALSQPVLQTLWEASQQYGAITDDNTQAILDQAEAQGLVGEAMKGVNDKILDVLLAIAHVFNADIPEGLEKTKTAASDATTDIENSFNSLKIETIDVPYKYKQVGDGIPTDGGDGGGGSGPAPQGVPALARGGVVRRPMYALIGEAGPEAVIPLTGNALGLQPSSYETNIYLDGDRIARSTAKRMPSVLRGVGVGG